MNVAWTESVIVLFFSFYIHNHQKTSYLYSRASEKDYSGNCISHHVDVMFLLAADPWKLLNVMVDNCKEQAHKVLY